MYTVTALGGSFYGDLGALSSGSDTKQAQQLLIDRWGLLFFLGRADGILGPKTWNAITFALGFGWWDLAGSEIVSMLQSGTTPALPAPPPPDRVREAQGLLGLRADGMVGKATWAALDRRLPDWRTRTWDSIVKGLGGTAGAVASGQEAPRVPVESGVRFEPAAEQTPDGSLPPAPAPAPTDTAVAMKTSKTPWGKILGFSALGLVALGAIVYAAKGKKKRSASK